MVDVHQTNPLFTIHNMDGRIDLLALFQANNSLATGYGNGLYYRLTLLLIGGGALGPKARSPSRQRKNNMFSPLKIKFCGQIVPNVE